MAPPKKRQKMKTMENDGDAMDVSSTSETSGSFIEPGIEQLMSTVTELQQSPDAETTRELTENAVLHFMKLKSKQRKLFESIRVMQTTLQEQKRKDDKHQLKLENLGYLKGKYQEMIEMSASLDLPNLLKLSCEELGLPQPEEADGKSDAMQKYLGSDFNDVSQQSNILDKINGELQGRKELGVELERLQKQNKNLKKSLNLKQKLLNGLHPKLRDIEKSSMGLQKFCLKSLSDTSPSLMLMGAKRIERIEKAETLPRPLYTIFYQLQMCIDTIEEFKPSAPSGSDDDSGTAIPVLDVDDNEGWVALHVPTPTIDHDGSQTMNNRRPAKIRFEYEEGNPYVTAFCSDKYGMKSLVDELFPGDTGELASASMAANVKDGGSVIPSESGGKPFHWCNFLAGIHVPKETPMNQAISTRVILRTIVKRARALATLNMLTLAIEKKSNEFPVHPALVEKFQELQTDNDCFRLKGNQFVLDVSKETCTEDKSSVGDAFSLVRIFDLTWKHAKKGTLFLRVKTDMARYPAVPPTWNISSTSNHGSEASSEKRIARLYDEYLASLERRVNDEFQSLVTEDEATYDWIFAHQLAAIACGWSNRE